MYINITSINIKKLLSNNDSKPAAQIDKHPPLAAPLKKKPQRLPHRLFCGLSREWNRSEKLLIGIRLLKMDKRKTPPLKTVENATMMC